MRGSTAGLADAFESESLAYRKLLTFLDVCFSSIVVAPAVISYWRGTWNLSGVYFFPDDVLLSSLVSMAIGFVGHVVFMMSQNALKRYLHPDRSRILFYVGSRLYSYIFGIVSVNAWRGAWLLIELLTKESGGSAASMAVSIVALITLRCIRNISTTPFSLATDRVDQYFDIPTMFRLSSSREPLLYFLDCMFSVVVTGSLVVFVWRGVWDLLDVYLFPEDRPWSAWVSFMIGYGLTAITFLLQGAANRACTILKGVQRLLVADLFLLLSFLATINVWWSIWRLLEVYFLPDNQELSYWITHCACFLLLMLLNCSNSVLVRGVYIDAEEEGGQCVIFPCYYLRLFFQKEKVKKRQKRLEAAAMEKSDGEIPVVQPHFSKSASSPHSVTVKTALLPTAKNHIVVHLPSQTEIPDNIKHEIENNKCKIVDQLSKVP